MAMKPADGPITQRYRENATVYNLGAGHGAVDMAVSVGDTIVAPEDGTVVFDGWAWDLPGGPNDWHLRWYLIKPARGDTKSGGGIITIFRNSAGSHWGIAHASESFLHVGDKVRKGQRIQLAGSTGSSTGPHTHVNLWPKAPNWGNGYFGAIDPEPYLTEKYAPLGSVVDRKTTAEGYMHGIDVSWYQPPNIVSLVSSQFVIVKTTEGVGWESDRWRQQLADARRLGKKVGVYHYARPGTNSSDAEADYFYRKVKALDSPDLVWFLDWEEPDYYGYTAWARDFMARLDKLTGKTTGLYANTAGLTAGTWTAKDKARPLWRAYPVLTGTGYATSFNLPAAPAGWARLVMDQYSFHGRLNGYGDDLDLNVYYGGIPQWGAVGSASTKKDWFDMATEADLRRIVREEIAKNNAAAAKAVMTYRVQNNGTHPVTGKPLTGFTTPENELKHSYLHALRARDVFDTVRAIADAVRPSTLLAVLRPTTTDKEA